MLNPGRTHTTAWQLQPPTPALPNQSLLPEPRALLPWFTHQNWNDLRGAVITKYFTCFSKYCVLLSVRQKEQLVADTVVCWFWSYFCSIVFRRYLATKLLPKSSSIASFHQHTGVWGRERAPVLQMCLQEHFAGSRQKLPLVRWMPRPWIPRRLKTFWNKNVRKLNPVSFLLLESADAGNPTARGQFGAAREPVLPGSQL